MPENGAEIVTVDNLEPGQKAVVSGNMAFQFVKKMSNSPPIYSILERGNEHVFNGINVICVMIPTSNGDVKILQVTDVHLQPTSFIKKLCLVPLKGAIIQVIT